MTLRRRPQQSFPVGEMTEQVTFYAPPTGASDSEKDRWGQVDQTVTSSNLGTKGNTVFARWETMGAQDAIRAGGEASEDMALVGLWADEVPTNIEEKTIKRERDSTFWDVVKARQKHEMDPQMVLTLKRSK